MIYYSRPLDSEGPLNDVNPGALPKLRMSPDRPLHPALALLSPAAAYKLIVDLEKLGILQEITGGKRGKQYLFGEYLQLFK